MWLPPAVPLLSQVVTNPGSRNTLPPLPWSSYSYSMPKLATARKKLGNPSSFPLPRALLLPKVNGIEVWGSLQTHGIFMQTEALAICPESGHLWHPVPKRVTPWCTLLVQGLLRNSTRASLRSCRGGTAASRLDCNGQPSVQPFQTHSHPTGHPVLQGWRLTQAWLKKTLSY